MTNQSERDMVVLKRNDVGDSNAYCHDNGEHYYITSDNEYFFFLDGDSSGRWVKSSNDISYIKKYIKPIEKKEMKEYLRKNSDGEYILEVTDEREAKEPHAKHWIEVPKGCDYLVSNLGVNSFIDSDMFSKVKPENILWSRKEMKEFLVNHDDKWTLQLLDSDTEENSYRVAVPSGAIEARLNKSGSLNFIRADGCWMNKATKGEWYGARSHDCHELVWQRSEDFTKVTIDELKHHVYKKDVSHLKIVDVYRVLELFDVKSHAVGHAIKKLLLSGDRGAKDEAQDIQEAIDSLIRYQEMKNEDERWLRFL